MEGNIIKKSGYNYDPGFGMHNARFSGNVIVDFFPQLISIYSNDSVSTDYTEGVYLFEMSADSGGNYISYYGACYDAKYGKRDSITGKKILSSEFTDKLEKNQRLSINDTTKLVNLLFPELDNQQIVELKIADSEDAITVMKD